MAVARKEPSLELSHEPKHHPACCLSLSFKLFESIEQLLQPVYRENASKLVILSVGCGSGFFENMLRSFLLKQELLNIQLRGVETYSTPTPYLPDEIIHRVQGTWDISDEASEADVLLFVYPREGRLVQRYMNRFSPNICMVLWLGPRADWAEQEAFFQDIVAFHKPVLLEDAGLASYEVVVTMNNSL
ncbi:hypothetical protein LTS08_003051 [Lithohypha guttulata]|nr:hypothetical protein LTS08_003051 [Lithohypha guttulata]